MENKPQRCSSRRHSESENVCVNSLTLPICSEYGHSRVQWPKKAFRIELQVLAIGNYSTSAQRSARRLCEAQHLPFGSPCQREKGEMVSHVLSLKKKLGKGHFFPHFLSQSKSYDH